MIKKVGLAISVILYFSALIFLLGMRDSLPPWEFTFTEWIVSGGFVAALAAALFVMFLARGVNNFSAIVIIGYLLVVTLSFLILFALYFSNIGISRVIILFSLIYLATVVFTFSLTRNITVHLLLSSVTLLFILFSYNWKNIVVDDTFKSTAGYAFSSYHDLKITNLKVNLASDWKGAGGAFAHVDSEQGLLITADGSAFKLAFSASAVEATKIDFNSPLELARYRENAPNPNTWYRITDALFYPKLNRLFLTYTFWHPEKQCYTVRLSSVDFDLPTYRQKSDWSLLYESSPCLKLKHVNNEPGGRMAVLDSERLIFTIGNFDYGHSDASKLAGSSYGKIYTLDFSSSELKVFTTGHRNSQGLLVVDGNIWATEHGPFGGDELNLLKEGNDYGWPYHSYGTDYGKKILTASNTVGDHSRGTKPIYAWLPSIAISNIIQYKGSEFSAWKDDLIIGSLRGLGHGYSLYRVRIREWRAVTVERIKTGLTVRDVAELPNGKLLLWSGKDIIQLVEQGENLFALCSGCHAMRPLTSGVGPSLSGIVNKKVASAKNYNYSQALTEFGGKWTTSRLDRFLENPQAVVPGTTMNSPGVEDEATRQEIIKYMSEIQLQAEK